MTQQAPRIFPVYSRRLDARGLCGLMTLDKAWASTGPFGFDEHQSSDYSDESLGAIALEDFRREVK